MAPSSGIPAEQDDGRVNARACGVFSFFIRSSWLEVKKFSEAFRYSPTCKSPDGFNTVIERHNLDKKPGGKPR